MVNSQKSKKYSAKFDSLKRFGFSIAILFMIGIIISQKQFRIDLTGDKRFTLSDESQILLRTIKEPVYIRVYLDGELPLQFLKLKNAINDLLTQYSDISDSNVDFEFINPYKNDKESQKELFNYLIKKGLTPMNIMDKDEGGGRVERLLFPGAIMVYKDLEIPLNLLKNNPSLSAEMNLNNSIQGLEYEFSNMIRNITAAKVRKVVFIEGHGELDEWQTADITTELANFYQVDRGEINGRNGILDSYEVVIIAKPTQPFSESDKFVLDQYLMNGGKIAWFIDAVNVSLDSLFMGRTMAIVSDLNLTDQLFSYGVRIDPVLVQDIQCNVIPVNNAVGGSQARFIPAPWLYNPLLGAGSQNAIVSGIDNVLGQFVNSIEWVGDNSGQKREVLLCTSQLSKIKRVPAMISLEEYKEQPQRNEFVIKNIPVAVILEGNFKSGFTNRPIQKYGGNPNAFLGSSKDTRMLVVADGDIIRNEITIQKGQPVVSPLGYDRYTRHTFGNRDFVLNSINYLTDDQGFMKMRGRELKLRMLDKIKIRDERVKWQLINLLLPLVILMIFGMGFTYYRYQKFGK